MLNPGEKRFLAPMELGGVRHEIILGRRIMGGRLVTCGCGWVDRFRHGRRRQERAARAHLDNWASLQRALDRG